MEARLEVEIKAAHKCTRLTSGPERLQRDLAEHGIQAGIYRIKRIRKKLGIRCKQMKKFKVTTDSKHSLPVAANLLNQQFKATAPMESFWGTLKQELVYHRRYQSRQETIQDITEYIEIFYNRQRRQAGLGFLAPVVYKQKFYAGRLAA